jgi:predicted N-acetyltransferase YhbS
MTQTTIRRYNQSRDYEKVGDFLVRTYRTKGDHINWLQPRWEYMHYHPLIRGVDPRSIGIWEAHDDVVGVVHPEHGIGTTYFEVAPEYGVLKAEMLRHAEEHLSSLVDGVRHLRVYINDEDAEFQALASSIGYAKGAEREPMSHFVIPAEMRESSLPAGFRLKSLAEDNDLRRVDRALWRGFDHGDEPPSDGIDDRRFMQSAPNYRKDLNVVVEAPDGNFVSYCGMWYEPVHSIAYVEPVATDPAYRRMALGRAAVLEGIRRCGKMGATVACVGSVKPFYLSLGFQLAYNSSVWQREWALNGNALRGTPQPAAARDPQFQPKG